MANEITVAASLSVSNGFFASSLAPGTKRYDQAAVGGVNNVVSVGSTAEEDIGTGDIGTLGWCMLRNLDATNYVTYGPKTTGGTMKVFGRIKAGETAGPMRLEPGIVIRARANTAPVKVQVVVLES